MLNFIKGRTSSTMVNGCVSSPMVQSHGVPQGSILGPILFNIFVNDLFNSVTNEIILFADDSTAIVTADSVRDLENKANDFLNQLKLWTIENKMSINAEKTKYMIFCCDEPLSLKLDQIAIQRVSQFKILGYIIEENLKPKKHLELIFSKLNKSLYFFYKNKTQKFPMFVKKLFFNAFVLHI